MATFNGTNFFITPTRLRLNRANYQVQLFSPTALWLSTTPTFTLTDPSSTCSLGTQAILTNTSATLLVTTGNMSVVISITDPSQSLYYNLWVSTIGLMAFGSFNQTNDDYKRRRR